MPHRTSCFVIFASSVALSACAGSSERYPELPRDAYPEGPFGANEGDTLENHAFLAPDGSTVDLQSVRAEERAQVLVLTTAAGWCSACIEEQHELEALYREHEADGLRVLVSLFEDADYERATPALAGAWRSEREVTFAVAADPEFALARYYDASLTPMNMVVDLGSMQIIRITTGWDRDLISTLVEVSL
jgi:peroxiredoxin